LRLAFLVLLAALPACADKPAPIDLGRKYFYEDIFRPFFTRKGAGYEATRPGAISGRFRAEKPAGGFRVFILGGSIAGTYGPDSLPEALSRALPGRTIEVLNCGMGGYESFREAMILDEVLDYSPDLIVLLSGHNEMLGSPPIPLWKLHAADRLAQWDAYRKLAASLPAHPPPGGPKEAAARDAAFARNVREMAERAKAKGAAFLVAVPPLNYREAPPQSPAFAESPAFMKGWLAFLSGDCAGARKSWRTLPEPPVRAVADFHLARCAEKDGDFKAAAALYSASLRGDHVGGGRCDPVCQESLRALARETGAAVVDLDAAFRAAAPRGLPGLDVFEDAVHWHRRYNALVSAEILKALRARPEFASFQWSDAALPAPAAEASQEEARAEVKITLANAFAGILHGADRLSHRAVAFLAGAERRVPGTLDDPARALGEVAGMRTSHQWTLGESWPDADSLRWYVGEARLLERKPAEAVEALARAARALPHAGPRLSLAAALAVAGREDEAQAALAGLSDPRARALSEALK
jgi:hypothetical protein